MATISRNSIRTLIKKKYGASITEGGVDELARILESEAKQIASFAVDSARKNKRGKVTRSDIRDYRIKGR